jgi:type I restriction enzyme, S subunit
MSEWRDSIFLDLLLEPMRTLADVIELIGGGTPKTSNPDYWNGDIPWLSVVDFNTGRKWVFNTEKKITLKGLENSSTKLLSKGDIVISARGTIGAIAVLAKPMAFNQSCYGIRGIAGKSLTDYVYYLVKNAISELQQIAHGAVFDTITRDTFNNIPVVYLPLLPEQKAIAAVLSSLDDKIDLLHRQNATLEAMAETLFKQWFVVEASDEWEDGKIEDLFILQRGFDLPAQNRAVGSYPIIAASGFSGGHIHFKVKAPGVTTGRSGLLGKVFFVQEDFWPLNTSLYIKEYRKGRPLFSYFTLKSLDLESFNAGSAVPTLNRNHVHNLTILIPPDNLISKFEVLMIPNFKKIYFNQKQIQTLEKLRDTLLPKLMSGEVRVRYE